MSASECWFIHKYLFVKKNFETFSIPTRQTNLTQESNAFIIIELIIFYLF